MAVVSESVDPSQWIPLVWKVVNRYARNHGEKPELFSTCALHLMRACKLYDSDDGRASFMTYAYKCLRCAVARHRQIDRNLRHCRGSHSVSRAPGPGLILFSELHPGFVRGKAREFAREDPSFARIDIVDECHGLLESLGSLDKRSRQLLRLLFGFESGGESLRKRADIFGISPERVRQIEARAVRDLKSAVSALGKLTTR